MKQSDTNIIRLNTNSRNNVEIKANDTIRSDAQDGLYLSLFEKIDTNHDGTATKEEIEVFQKSIEKNREYKKHYEEERQKESQLKSFGQNLAAILTIAAGAGIMGFVGYRAAGTLKGLFNLGQKGSKILTTAGKAFYTPTFAALGAAVATPFAFGTGYLGGKIAEATNKSEETIKSEFELFYSDTVNEKNNSNIFVVDKKEIES